MSTFISLCNFEREGLEELVSKGPALKKLLKLLAEQFEDTELQQIWLTTGMHDLVVVVESASEAQAVSFVMALNVFGVCATTTLSAVGDLDAVIKAANDAHAKMHAKMDDDK